MGTIPKSQTRLTATRWGFAGNIPNTKDRGSMKECIPFKIKLLPIQAIWNSPPLKRKSKTLPSCLT